MLMDIPMMILNDRMWHKIPYKIWAGNCTAQGPCYYKDVCPTLKAAGPHSVAIIKDEDDDTE